MRIKEDNYEVFHDPDTALVIMSGFFSLKGREEYKEIEDLLDQAVRDASKEAFTLDIRMLDYLNTTGIRLLGKFIIELRKKGGIRLTILCAKSISWQVKSMRGLLKLMPDQAECRFE